MFGLPSASGLALALARRVRDLIEVFVGLGWLARSSRSCSNQSVNPIVTEIGEPAAA